MPLEQHQSQKDSKKSKKKQFENLFKKGPDSNMITSNKKNSIKNIHIIHQNNDSQIFHENNANFKN